jgi:hypothetical protein
MFLIKDMSDVSVDILPEPSHQEPNNCPKPISRVVSQPCIEIRNHIHHKQHHNPAVHKQHAITATNKIWKSGTTGNINLTFGYYDGPGPNTESVSVEASWSHIGSASNDAYPSMNLGFIDPPMDPFEYNGRTYYPDIDAFRNYYTDDYEEQTGSAWIPGCTVIHEFCHALGMMHEHQNFLYNDDLKLNKQAVIDHYIELGFDEEMAYENVLETYTHADGEYDGTKFDKDSIMLYYLPDEWMEPGCKNPTKPNFELSKLDIEWLQKMYPMTIDEAKWPILNVNFIDNEPEPWKKAWVKKMVTETFGPIIGVKFRFHDRPYKKYRLKSACLNFCMFNNFFFEDKNAIQSPVTPIFVFICAVMLKKYYDAVSIVS